MIEKQTFSIDRDVLWRLERAAERFGIAKSAMVTQILRMHLAKLEKEDVFWVLKEFPANYSLRNIKEGG